MVSCFQALCQESESLAYRLIYKKLKYHGTAVFINLLLDNVDYSIYDDKKSTARGL